MKNKYTYRKLLDELDNTQINLCSAIDDNRTESAKRLVKELGSLIGYLGFFDSEIKNHKKKINVR
jgi:hypothetical protein